MTLIKPDWIVEAEKHIGLKEVPGPGNNPVIVGWLTKLKAWWKEDQTPWCGTFVAICLRVSGASIPNHWYRAKAYLDWGITLSEPVYGCIVVFMRTGGGHVGFVVGKDALGRLLVLGGNQKDSVSIAPFDRSRVAGYIWPEGFEVMQQYLPLMHADGKSSANEA